MNKEIQIAVNEIDNGTTPIEVKRGVGSRIMNLAREAGVMRISESQQAQDIAHGADPGLVEITPGADLSPVEITPDMQRRIDAIRNTPEQRL